MTISELECLAIIEGTRRNCHTYQPIFTIFGSAHFE